MCPFYRTANVPAVERRRIPRDNPGAPQPLDAPWCAHLYTPVTRVAATAFAGGWRKLLCAKSCRANDRRSSPAPTLLRSCLLPAKPPFATAWRSSLPRAGTSSAKPLRGSWRTTSCAGRSASIRNGGRSSGASGGCAIRSSRQGAPLLHDGQPSCRRSTAALPRQYSDRSMGRRQCAPKKGCRSE